jgi:hypothetical protein
VSRVMEYDFNSDRSRSTPGGICAGSGGGGMDDVMKRLGVLERDMSDLKVQVGSIAAQLPHLATKAEIGDLKAMTSAEIGGLRAMTSAEIGGLRAMTSAEIGGLRATTSAEIGDLRAAISEAKTSIVQWVVGTTIAAAGIAFAIAKLVH